MIDRPQQIEKRLSLLKSNIHDFARKVNLSGDDITLVCVTKFAAPEDVLTIIRLGEMSLGENRVQDAGKKIEFIKQSTEPELFKKINWQLIGHLQTNKAKKAVAIFDLIQSVDSIALAEIISSQAAKENKNFRILIQVNISREESKFGITPESANTFVAQLIKLPRMRLEGLMGISPIVKDPELARPFYRELNEIYKKTNEFLMKNNCPQMRILSMGMTNDYGVAIEEGSNMVRIGSAIFGG